MSTSEESEVRGLHYRTGEPLAVTVQGGVIADIRPIADSGDLPWMAPGLVDLQVNGFAGLDFNTLPLSTDTVFNITRALWEEGVTSYLPTVITNDAAAIESALHAIAQAIRQEPMVAQSIAGIHLEGPFISPEDGPRGAHHLDYVTAPDWALFERWQKAADGHIRLVTLSPEWPSAEEFIRRCSATGVKVSIGHTAADSRQIAAAVQAGATLSTHLGNGSHTLIPRHPNYIWDQLANDGLWACVIGDGFHLPASVLKVAMRVKGDKAILVSDAVYLAGLQPGEYVTHIGGRVVLTEEGKLHLADNPQLLAGSVQSLRQGISNLLRQQLCELADAWEMGSLRPAQYLGLPGSDGLAVGAPADLVLFERQATEIRIIQTLKVGRFATGLVQAAKEE